MYTASFNYGGLISAPYGVIDGTDYFVVVADLWLSAWPE